MNRHANYETPIGLSHGINNPIINGEFANQHSALQQAAASAAAMSLIHGNAQDVLLPTTSSAYPGVISSAGMVTTTCGYPGVITSAGALTAAAPAPVPVTTHHSKFLNILLQIVFCDLLTW